MYLWLWAIITVLMLTETTVFLLQDVRVFLSQIFSGLDTGWKTMAKSEELLGLKCIGYKQMGMMAI